MVVTPPSLILPPAWTVRTAPFAIDKALAPVIETEEKSAADRRSVEIASCGTVIFVFPKGIVVVGRLSCEAMVKSGPSKSVGGLCRTTALAAGPKLSLIHI